VLAIGGESVISLEQVYNSLVRCGNDASVTLKLRHVVGGAV